MKQETPEDLYKLTPSQSGILFHSLLTPEADAYFHQTTSVLRGRIDPAAFEQAWQRAVDRHTILRTSFLWEGLEKPLQIVHRRARLPFVQHDWRDLSEAEQRQRLAGFLAEDRRRGFDPTAAPLLRIALIRLADDAYHLVWAYHHLILDGWSVPLLTREVFDLYQSLCRGTEPALVPPRPFRLYIEWLQRQDLGRAETFWRKALAGVHAPTVLQLDGTPRAGAESGEEWFGVRRTFLPGAAMAALQELGWRQGLTLNTLVQGAWALLLGRYTGQRDVLFGTVSSGRPAELPGAEQMIGVFINTLPVRAQMPPDTSVLSWLATFQRNLLDLRQFDYSPLVEVQGWSAVPRGQALFESLVVFENYPLGEAAPQGEGGAGLEVEGAEFKSTTNYPLTLLAGALEVLTLDLIFDRRRFDDVAVERLLAHYLRLLEALPADPQRRLGDTDVLMPAERHQLLSEWNDTEVPESSPASVVELFDGRAEASPEALAVIAENERLTYRELRGRVDRLAGRLVALGVGRDAVVGVLLERSLEMVVALFAVMKAGGAYLPLDPESPSARLAGILEESRPAGVLTQSSLAGLLPAETPGVLVLDQEWKTLPSEKDGPPGARPERENLAYVIYTSGSTGRPKGVMNHHRGLLNRIVWMQEAFRLEGDDRVLQKTPFTFDVSVWEFFWPLAYGACLVVAKPGGHRDPGYLARLIADEGVTTIHFVPSMLQALLEEPDLTSRCSSLRRVIASGEALSPELRKRFFERLHCELHNLYGPTEAAIDVTVRTCAPDESGPVPIGRPIRNTRIHLLDSVFRPVPIGVAGELCIGGVQPARGYLDRPDLTAERFVPDPFANMHGATGARLYRTGDLARHAADGEVEFLGRFDHQVKIRGFRIELGEIEAALLAHLAVRDAVVAVYGEVSSARRLAAYLVSGSDTLPPAAELRTFLRQRLPDFMIPSVFVELPALPLTSSGKVDRRALSLPGAPGAAGDSHRAPRTPIEELVAGIWTVVLGAGQVGIDDDFFEIGGHSLLATQVISRIRQALGIDLPLATLFGAPTVARLAERVDEEIRRGAGSNAPQLERVSRGLGLPLSYSQERLWLLDQLDPELSNVPFAVRILGPLAPSLLAGALRVVVARHEALRTRFLLVEEALVQVIGPAGEIPLPLLDLSGLPPDVREREARRIVRREGGRRFDLERGPLLRARLLRLTPREHVALLATHHIASDAWSLGILLREMTAAYAALGQGEFPVLPDLPVQYADFAIWQRRWLEGEVFERQLDFWRRQLAGSDPFLELPVNPWASAAQERREGRRTVDIARPLADALRQLGRREGATLFMTLLAVLQVLLGRHSGQLRFNIGSSIAGRGRLETEGLIGCFINTLVFSADLSGDPPFRKLLRRVRDAALGAYAHQDLPYEKLLEALQPPRRSGMNSVFQVLLTLHNVPPVPDELALPELSVRPFEPLESDWLRFGLLLNLELAETRDGLGGVLRYRRGLLQEPWVDRFLEQFLDLAAQAVERPDAPLSELRFATLASEAAAGFNEDLE